MKKLCLALLALFIVGCDYSGEGVGYDVFNDRFHYYYSDVCDDFDRCDGVVSISPSYTASLRIEYDGFATLNLDGDIYQYFASSYIRDVDSYGEYYEFTEDGWITRVYLNGDILVIYDSYSGISYYYYYDMYY